MPLIKHGRLADDPWATVADEDPLPEGPAIISLARWQKERDLLQRRPAPLGILLKSDQSPTAIAGDLDRFAVIALEFPKFTDGRAYSSARLLRERYRYAGELRAVGNVLRDQLLFMHRCGFDAFAIAHHDAVHAFAKALGEVTIFYQPAADHRRSVLALRREAANAPKERGDGFRPAS
jgi:uncharacterized protein (DUF934 family)